MISTNRSVLHCNEHSVATRQIYAAVQRQTAACPAAARVLRRVDWVLWSCMD